jgi:hypothetical protein
MVDWIDMKFAKFVGMNLEQFKQTGKKFNFRCPYCGDSKKNPFKSRGYLYEHNNAPGLVYKCHNCGKACSFDNFLKDQNSQLHTEYKMEKMQAKGQNKMTPQKTISEFAQGSHSRLQKFIPDDSVNLGEKISDLPKDHVARLYLESRLIPTEAFPRMFYTDDIAPIAIEINPEYAKRKLPKGPRIVLPLKNANGDLFGFNSRAIDDNDMRYITLVEPDFRGHRYYGMERFNRDKPGYVVEGPFDSEFLPNCLAIVGANHLKQGHVPFDADKVTVVFDNEPRNKDICKLIQQTINAGFRVCIWDSKFPYKDLNKAVENGVSPENLKKIIDENSVKGLKATLKFTAWKSCVC